MSIDPDLLRAARGAEARLVDAERAADLARAEFRHAVRRVHLAGGSLREIADALGLSHQRIHQIVEEAGGGRGWRSSTRRGQDIRRDLLACSFCGKTKPPVKSLIAGPGVYICEQCVDKVHRVVATGEVAATPLCAVKALGLEAATAKCSFCGKRRHQVDGLATTGHDSICSECVALCREIIREELD
jgi:hypothetical protein